MAGGLNAFLKAAWRGELPLWFQFWVLYLFGSCFLAAICSAMMDMYEPVEEIESILMLLNGIFLLVTLFVGLIAYEVLVMIGLWRSAGRYACSRVWSVLTRLYIVASLALIAAWIIEDLL